MKYKLLKNKSMKKKNRFKNNLSKISFILGSLNLVKKAKYKVV